MNYILNKPENLNQAWLDMTRPEKPEELNKNWSNQSNVMAIDEAVPLRQMTSQFPQNLAAANSDSADECEQ